MHVLVVNFTLQGVDESQYVQMCDAVAPAFAAVPGLLSKLWLKDSDAGIYGGFYIFEDQQAFARYKESDLFRTVATHPNFANVTARDYGILEAPTRVTHGFMAAVS